MKRCDGPGQGQTLSTPESSTATGGRQPGASSGVCKAQPSATPHAHGSFASQVRVPGEVADLSVQHKSVDLVRARDRFSGPDTPRTAVVSLGRDSSQGWMTQALRMEAAMFGKNHGRGARQLRRYSSSSDDAPPEDECVGPSRDSNQLQTPNRSAPSSAVAPATVDGRGGWSAGTPLYDLMVRTHCCYLVRFARPHVLFTLCSYRRER